jgi:hypothetical protein
MKNRLRFAFITCSYDPWISPVLEDVLNVSRDLEYEVLILGSHKDALSCSPNFIDLEHLVSEPVIYNYPGPLFAQDVDLSPLIRLEIEFLKRIGVPRGLGEHDIKVCMTQWLNEAIVLLKLIQPDVIIVWNGLISQRGIYARAGEYLNIPVLYAEKGMLPGSWYIDPLGINAQSSIADKEFIAKTHNRNLERMKEKLQVISKKGSSAWEQPERESLSALKTKLGITSSQEVIFFPGQVDDDSNIILFSPHFEDTLKALKWLADDLPGEEFFILAKPHPKGRLNDIDFNRVIRGHGQAVSDLNIIDAIEIASCIITINSTVAFEAALSKKPVLQMGKGVLSQKTFVSLFEPEKSARDQVRQCMETYREQKEIFYNQALTFAAYLDSEYYAYRGDPDSTRQILTKAVSKIQINQKNFTLEEIDLIFKKATIEELSRIYPAKMLIKTLGQKMQRRIKGIFKKGG